MCVCEWCVCVHIVYIMVRAHMCVCNGVRAHICVYVTVCVCAHMCVTVCVCNGVFVVCADVCM